ncbi:VOC family protein [Brachybacterium sp. J144]|uniref:VOC family protein n=1 Tax=Brachybacterium sp. J144 TaxID=3116487 RepID=UPI002E7821B0|nr:VOC family protein [Brachybacterium sp. J144]MEE1650416.1 VOC family protein [Brachybacterium sp. J144]
MPAALHPYLNFDGNAREAFEFYGAALGATPQFATFGEFQAVPADDPAADKIMHGSLEVTELIRLYVSDVVEGMGEHKPGTNVTLSLMGDDEAVLRSAYEKLSVGGTIQMPLEKQMWGDVYGAFTDRFGIEWQVNISGAES